jgi:hypothetical protein
MDSGIRELTPEMVRDNAVLALVLIGATALLVGLIVLYKRWAEKR